MSYKIEILDNNTVEIFAEGSDVPFLRQPNWPNQTPWANSSESRAWAEMFIESIEVADAPYAPAGPGLDRELKSTPEQIAEREAVLNPAPPTV